MPGDPGNIIIIKKDGAQTGRMPQSRAENYLIKLIDKDRYANLKQAMNDITGDKGKATTHGVAGKGKGAKSHYVINGQNILHASSGNGQKSVTLFFYNFADVHYIFAMGEHISSDAYELSDYGQDNNPTYKTGTVIDLSAKL